jgi:hypothetical protein
MFTELAQYVYPKRKAVELATDPVAPPQSKLVVEKYKEPIPKRLALTTF